MQSAILIRNLFHRVPRTAWSTLLFGLVIVFLVVYLRSIDIDRLRAIDIDWSWLFVASLFGITFRYLGAYIWRVILMSLGSDHLPRYAVTNDVYARAWMGRYIPGTVTWIAGKVYLASNWGISKSRLAVASLLEGGVQVVAITFVSFLLLGFDPRLDTLSTAAKLLLIGLGFAVLLILTPGVFNRLISLVYRTVKRRPVPKELGINNQAVSRSFALYTLGALLSGVASFYVVKAVVPTLGSEDLLFVIGASGLAAVAGMAAPFAPSGLGVRDGLQLLLLTAIMPKELALASTVVLRLWSVALDILFLGLTRTTKLIIERHSA